jgi:hypothetical protein
MDFGQPPPKARRSLCALVLGARRLLEEQAHDSAEEMQMRAALGDHLVHQVRDAEALDHRERDALHDREHDDLRAADVIDRLPEVEHVAGPRIAEPARRPRRRLQHLVRHPHALRRARGARGVADEDGVLLRRGDRGPRRVGVRAQRLEGDLSGRTGVEAAAAHDQQLERAGLQDGLQLRGKARIDDQRPRLGMRDLEAERVAAQMDVERHLADAEPQHRPEGDHVVRRVRQHHRDAIAARNPCASSALAKRFTACSKRADRDRASLPAQIDVAGILGDAGIEHRLQRQRRELRRPARQRLVDRHRRESSMLGSGRQGRHSCTTPPRASRRRSTSSGATSPPPSAPRCASACTRACATISASRSTTTAPS